MTIQVQSRRVVVFGINYWPEEIGIAPYTTGLAEDLARRGWDVTVVTGLPHYPSWRVTPGFGRRLRHIDERNGVKIRRLWHYVPDRQSAVRRGGYEATFFCHGLAQLRIERPDVVLGVVPSLGGGALATLAAKRWSVPSGVIVQDLMSNAAKQSGIAGGGRVAKLTERIESRVCRAADKVAIVSESFRPTALSFGVPPGRIVHLRNWSRIPEPTRDRRDVRHELGWGRDEFVVLHAGNMGLKQALENVIATARLAQQEQPHIRFMLMGAGSQRANLERLAVGHANLQFLDPRPIEQLSDVLAAADALLVNERASVVDMSLPSKLTSYFVAGRPVLAAVADGATANEVRRSGAGIVVPAEHPPALLHALTALAGDPALAERLGAMGTNYASTTLSKDLILRQAEAFVCSLINGNEHGGAEVIPGVGVRS